MRDNSTSPARILHLTTEDGEFSNFLQEHDDGRWNVDNSFSQVGDDIAVRDRYNEVINFLNNLNAANSEVKESEQVRIKYNVRGDLKAGINCENLVRYIMEGRTDAQLGKIAAFMEDYLGINVARMASGKPGSSRR